MITFLQHAATRCNMLQHAATHCNTLQLEILEMIAERGVEAAYDYFLTTHCNTLQHAATHCSARSWQ